MATALHPHRPLQTLKGTIKFAIKDSVSLRSIAVHFEGSSRVSFSAGEEGKRTSYFDILLPLNGEQPLAEVLDGLPKFRSRFPPSQWMDGVIEETCDL